jgi:hypothetical protein
MIIWLPVLCCLICSNLWAANTLTIESKTVPANGTGITLGLYITNDDSLAGVQFPLAFRSVTPGAYIVDTLSYQSMGRVATELGDWNVLEFLPTEGVTPRWECDSYGFKTRAQPDFVSPDGLVFFGTRTLGACMAPGDDGQPPGGTPSGQFFFNVTGVEGTFEIDTICATPAGHLLFVNEAFEAIVPVFTKAVVTIVDTCICICHGDPVCDSVHNVLDFVAVIDVAFRGADPMPDPSAFCPYETTDLNCDSVTNVLDVSLMSQVVNFGANPDSTFCDPCP